MRSLITMLLAVGLLILPLSVHAWYDVAPPAPVAKAVAPAAAGGGGLVCGPCWAIPFVLLAMHDLLYYGWDGLFTPNAEYVKYVDWVNRGGAPK